MNCLQFQDQWQEHLDGRPPAEPGTVTRHLAECASCRDWYAAASRFEDGLRLLTPPPPPSGLAARIVSEVLKERNQRRARVFRVVRTTAALAASLLLLVLAGDRLGNNPPTTGVVTRDAPSEPVAIGSLRDHVADAGDAVVSLGKRTADEAVGHGRLLLDVVKVPSPPEPTMPPMPPIEPPVRSLASAGQAIGTGLEPVANSAKRAFDLLLRDLPPMDQPEPKPGL